MDIRGGHSRPGQQSVIAECTGMNAIMEMSQFCRSPTPPKHLCANICMGIYI